MDDWHRRYKEQATWTAGLRQYLFDRLDITHSRNILEVGCGTGAVLENLPLEDPKLVVGLDIDNKSVQFAASQNAHPKFLTGRGESLPFLDSSFDVVYCHFLLLWVQEPRNIIKEMARVTRPGGFVILFAEPDYGGRIDFPAELETAGLLQVQALTRQGAHPLVGRQLGHLLGSCHLTNIGMGLLGGEWPFPNHQDWTGEKDILVHDLAPVMSRQELDDLLQAEQTARQSGERLLFVPTFYAFGSVPAGA